MAFLGDDISNSAEWYVFSRKDLKRLSIGVSHGHRSSPAEMYLWIDERWSVALDSKGSSVRDATRAKLRSVLFIFILRGSISKTSDAPVSKRTEGTVVFQYFKE